jgi:hypothetical protein
MPTDHAIKPRQEAPLLAHTDIDQESVQNISGALNALLADVFALYHQGKNSDRHQSGPHIRAVQRKRGDPAARP